LHFATELRGLISCSQWGGTARTKLTTTNPLSTGHSASNLKANNGIRSSGMVLETARVWWLVREEYPTLSNQTRLNSYYPINLVGQRAIRDVSRPVWLDIVPRDRDRAALCIAPFNTDLWFTPDQSASDNSIPYRFERNGLELEPKKMNWYGERSRHRQPRDRARSLGRSEWKAM